VTARRHRASSALADPTRIVTNREPPWAGALVTWIVRASPFFARCPLEGRRCFTCRARRGSPVVPNTEQPWDPKVISAAIDEVTALRADLVALQVRPNESLRVVHPDHAAGAASLVHYVGLRRHEVRTLQDRLAIARHEVVKHDLAGVELMVGKMRRAFRRRRAIPARQGRPAIPPQSLPEPLRPDGARRAKPDCKHRYPTPASRPRCVTRLPTPPEPPRAAGVGSEFRSSRRCRSCNRRIEISTVSHTPLGGSRRGFGLACGGCRNGRETRPGAANGGGRRPIPIPSPRRDRNDRR
jgi:hypothetical protein